MVRLKDGYALVGRTESNNLGGKRAVLFKTDLLGNNNGKRFTKKAVQAYPCIRLRMMDLLFQAISIQSDWAAKLS